MIIVLLLNYCIFVYLEKHDINTNYYNTVPEFERKKKQ